MRRWTGLSPHVRGNPSSASPSVAKKHGLSPRVRGNLRERGGLASDSGSIPARAGEPAVQLQRLTRRGVYPRACGGTVFLLTKSARYFGLSPRVRGNQNVLVGPLRCVGSIPARAGEPGRFRPGFTPRVYPRACGGNHRTGRRTDSGRGSIPARAGEPFSILPSSGKPSARVGYRDTSSTASGSLREHRARPPFAE